jgi:hypothetical protein
MGERAIDPRLQRRARDAAPKDVVVEHVGAAERQRFASISAAFGWAA